VGQKEGVAKPRGRPREYDPDTALQRATEVFWKTGYASASLDDIAAAAGMNRPSLRAAFGDKHALYLTALRAYWDRQFAILSQALEAKSVETALMCAYETALAIYFSADEVARGCFVVGTALTEAPEDAEIQAIVSAGFRRLDADFAARLRTAREAGELRRDADPEALAVMATATLHTLAVRARAGAPRETLLKLVRQAVSVICG
jgi:AcrR family transcriptional regulator